MQRIKSLLTSPIAAGAVVIGTVGQVGFAAFDPIWGLISATSGLWFPAIATTAATIMPEIGLADLGTKILVGAAIVFVAVQLDRLIERGRKYLRNR